MQQQQAGAGNGGTLVEKSRMTVRAMKRERVVVARKLRMATTSGAAKDGKWRWTAAAAGPGAAKEGKQKCMAVAGVTCQL